MFNVIYNTNLRNLPEKIQKQVDLLIQAFKRSIIFKRYARCTNANLNNIIYDKNRICAHWIILCKKIISFRTYQGKDKKVIVKLKEAIENMLSLNIPTLSLLVERSQELQMQHLQQDAGNEGDTESMVYCKGNS